MFEWIDDLDRYPEWLGIVRRTLRLSDEPTDPAAWTIDLEAQLGPLARAKRLRMERTVHDRPRLAVFERRELDGREHGDWTLRAEVLAAGTGCRLEMRLRYDGRLWGPAVAAVLDREIERSRERLLDLVST